MYTITKKILVNDVMSDEFITVSTNISLNKMIDLFLEKNIDDIFIIDQNNKLLSLFSYKDIVEIMKNENLNLRVAEYIDKKIISISPYQNIITARDYMRKYNIGRLPVLKNGELIGVIRKNDVIKNYYQAIEGMEIEIKQILNSIHEAITVIDENGIVKVWNENAEKLYNISKGRVIGRHLKKTFPNALMLDVLENEKKYDNLHYTLNKGRQVAISAHPIYAKDKLIGVVASERDITEVKELSEELKEANKTVKRLEKKVKSINSNEFKDILGKSKCIKKVIEKAKQVSKTKASILITGESGTGKEIFAKAIHSASDREGKFIPVNCSAIPLELFESEFFGYKEGAFTDALKGGKKGYFELANKGTIFLDEIGELDLSAQSKLLRVLQEYKIKPVGSEKYKSLDIRVISATNRDLVKMIEKGEFREDLYFRLNVINLSMPSLRKRCEDIEIMVRAFIKEYASLNNKKILGMTQPAINQLMAYHWPGNVRELKNAVEQMIVLSNDTKLTKSVVPNYIKRRIKSSSNNNINKPDTFDLNILTDDLEKRMIKKALDKFDGNKTKAAKILNIPRATLYYKINNLEIDV